MKENNEKILKIIHIAAMSLWFSSIVIMGTITLSLKGIATADAFKYAHKLVYIIDMYILTPAAVLTLLTAVVYAFFTKWKVKENLWLKVKAIITLLLIVAGTFYLAPLFSGMVESVQQSGLDVLNSEAYLKDLSKINWFVVINGILVLFVIAISTIKPGNSVK
jgi:hypothetical protein